MNHFPLRICGCSSDHFYCSMYQHTCVCIYPLCHFFVCFIGWTQSYLIPSPSYFGPSFSICFSRRLFSLTYKYMIISTILKCFFFPYPAPFFSPTLPYSSIPWKSCSSLLPIFSYSFLNKHQSGFLSKKASKIALRKALWNPAVSSSLLPSLTFSNLWHTCWFLIFDFFFCLALGTFPSHLPG